MLMTPAVLLDRDGTLIEEVGYLDRLERLKLFPSSIDAVRLLNRAGFRVVVVTNQAGVAHGMFDERFVAETHRFLDEKMAQAGARVDRYYYCPHHPNAGVERYRMRCECRKPGTGMIRQAAADLDLDIPKSFVVGDRWLDIEMAKGAGARGILVRTGYGATEEARPRDGVTADAIVDNLIEATTWILRHAAS
jgi:D-glycero-D-manno-heptose 1,7-bisphosphate phosphatase